MGKAIRRPRIDVDVRSWFGGGHGPQTPEFIVIHDTESHDYAGIRDITGIVSYWYHRSGARLGSQVIIDKEALSGWVINENQRAYAVENHNTGALHIEMIGFAKFTPSIWWTRMPQLEKCARWCAFWHKTYGIPIQTSTTSGICTHKMCTDLYGGSHYDPGPFFPFQWLLRRTQQLVDVGGWE